MTRALLDSTRLIVKPFGAVFFPLTVLTTAIICCVFKQLFWPVVLLSVSCVYTIILCRLGFYGQPLAYARMMMRYSLAKGYQSYGLLDLSDIIIAEELKSPPPNQSERLAESSKNLFESLHKLQLIKQGRLSESEDLALIMYDRYKQKAKEQGSMGTLPYQANSLAALYITRGKFAEGEELFAQTRAQLEQDLRADSPAYGTAILGLAQAALERHRFNEAEGLARRYVRYCKDAAGTVPKERLDRHHDREIALETSLMMSQWLLGRIYRMAGEPDKAINEIQPAIEKFSSDSRMQTRLSLLLGDLFIEQGHVNLLQKRFEEAEESYDSALDYFEQRTAYFGPARGEAVLGKAYAQFKQGKEVPLAEFQRGFQLQERELLVEHPVLADSLFKMAEVYLAKGMLEDAGQAARRALDIRRLQFDQNDIDLAKARILLAKVLDATGSGAEALEQYKLALASFEAKNKDGNEIAEIKRAMAAYGLRED